MASDDKKSDASIIDLKYIILLPLIHLAISVGTGISCFIVAIIARDVTFYIPLLSETGDIGAQRVIFIIGGIFMGITAHQIMTFRYLLQQFYFSKDKYHWQILNTTCYFIGLFSITVLIIVIGFPARTEVTTHTIAAAVFFVGILLYTCYDCFLNHHVVQTHELIGRKLRILQMVRILLCIGQLLSCFLYLVIYPLAQEKWITNHEKRPAMKTPADEGFWIMAAACVFEWLSIITLVAYFSCFTFDFTNFHITLQAVPYSIKPPEDSSSKKSDSSKSSKSSKGSEDSSKK